MSETCTTFGRLTVCVQDDGSADITHDFGPVDDDDSPVHWETIDIPAEHRLAVALALMGKSTNDVLIAINEAYTGFLVDPAAGTPTRSIFAAIFGPAAHD